MKKLGIILLTCVTLTGCGRVEIKTVPEKIGNLTIEAPVGWDKDIDDSSEFYTFYSYSDTDGDRLLAYIFITVDKKVNPDFSINDFDYEFEDSHDGADSIFTEINDDFLGDKPIRKGQGTWQYNFNNKKGELFDQYVAAMYDADCRKIKLSYRYVHDLADKGYEAYYEKLFSTMLLTYDYQQQ